MSDAYCRFCDTHFVSGRPCRDIAQRDRCSEWAAQKMAECDYWNGRRALGDAVGEARKP